MKFNTDTQQQYLSLFQLFYKILFTINYPPKYNMGRNLKVPSLWGIFFQAMYEK